MNEEIKKEIWENVEMQVDLIELIKHKLDDRLGENSYPVDLIVATHNWVNKWLMSKSIHEQRQQRYEKPQTKEFPPKKKIILTDGDKKTIEVKEQLKQNGWHYDADMKAWTKEMTGTEWNTICGKEPYKYLFARWEE